MWVAVLVVFVGCTKSASGEQCYAASQRIEKLTGSTTAAATALDSCVTGWSVQAADCVAAIEDVDALATSCRDLLGDPALALSLAVSEQRRILAERELRLERDRCDGLKLSGPGELQISRASLVLEVTSTTITAGGKVIADADLDPLLRTAFARDRDTQIVIKTDKDVAHGRVVAIMERAKAVGLTHLAIGTNH